jgi:hypothetical protein
MRRTAGIRARARISGDGVTTILAFALKRSIIARIQKVADGSYGSLPPGTEVLARPDVQVNPILPADPDRVCVYGTPVRSTRQFTTEERRTVTETVTCEIRIRVYQPGQQDEDVGEVDLLTGQVANAVGIAVLDTLAPVVDPSFGSISLSDVTQWPTALSPAPESSVTGLASLIFTAELVTN